MNRKRLAFSMIGGLLLISLATFIWLRQRPVRVVEAAIQKLVEAQTQGFKSVIRIENSQATQEILGEQATIELNVDGVYAREEDKRDSVDAQVLLTTKTDSVTLSVEGNVRFIDNKAYFEVTKAPMSFPAIAALKGQWIEMPRGEGTEGNKVENDEPMFTEVKKGKAWRAQDKKARTYNATATRAAVIGMLDGVARILGTHLSDEQVQSIREGIANTETLPVDLAVAPWRRELYQIKTVATVPGNSNNISVEINLADRNKKVEITAPEGARKLEDLATQNSLPSGE